MNNITKYLTPYNHNIGDISRIKYIVIHYVGALGGAKANCQWYASGYRGASAHYYVGFDGEIWQSVEDQNVAWHCGAKSYKHPECRNSNSIGIEMCVRNNGNQADTSRDWYFEDATVESTIELTKWLMKKYNISPTHVIRHHDVTGKICLPTDTTELLTKYGWRYLRDVKTDDIVATYDAKNDQIIFDKVLDVVEPYETQTVKCRNLEATGNHIMYAKPNSQNSHVFRDIDFQTMLSGKKQYIVKNASNYYGTGLDLTDDQIRLLAWVQGDGHYIKNKDVIYGVLFHLKKERKIKRLVALLKDLKIEYSYGKKTDNTVGIRINSKEFYQWCEVWLKDKQFTYKMIEMTETQFNVFWNELLVIDGNVQKNLYSSSQERNIDVVQAICSLHNTRTNKCSLGTKNPSAIIRVNSQYSIGGCKKKIECRNTEVSCITVPTGYILIRQIGKTFIVGNCPNPYVYNQGKHTWNDFKKAISDPIKKSGWHKENDKWYFYLGDTGMPVMNNWYNDETGHWAWFDGSGRALCNQWYKYENNWYYFGTDCYMCSSQWIEYNGNQYYLTSDGKMATNAYIKSKDPKLCMYYWVNEIGIWEFELDTPVPDLKKCKLVE